MPEKILQFPTPKPQKKPAKPKRADGRYERVITHVFADGTKARVSGYSRKSNADAKRDAERRIAQREQEIAAAAEQARMDAEDARVKSLTEKNQTLGKWAETWNELYNKSKSPGSRGTYQAEVRRIQKHRIGSMLIGDVSQSDLQGYVNGLEGKSVSLVTKSRVALTGLFAAATGNGLISDNPMASKGLVMPKGTHTGHRDLEPWEKDLVIDHWQCHPLGLLALFALCTSYGRGEALPRRWGDIDFAMGRIAMPGSMRYDGGTPDYKTGRAKNDHRLRTVRLLPILRKALEVTLQQRGDQPPDALIFPSPTGQMMPEKTFQRHWCQLMAAYSEVAGKPVHFTLHDLRVTYATDAYYAGRDIKMLQRDMGHSSFEMVMKIYTKLRDEEERLGGKKERQRSVFDDPDKKSVRQKFVSRVFRLKK